MPNVTDSIFCTKNRLDSRWYKLVIRPLNSNYQIKTGSQLNCKMLPVTELFSGSFREWIQTIYLTTIHGQTNEDGEINRQNVPDRPAHFEKRGTNFGPVTLRSSELAQTRFLTYRDL